MISSSHMSMGEAHRRITDYLNRFSDVVSYQDASSLKHLLSLSSESPSFLSLADALHLFQDANRLIRQADKYSQYAEIVAPLFRAMQSYRVGHLVESYLTFEKSANAFIQEFLNWESAWALEALYVVVYEIRILAERADRELASNGKTQEKLKAARSFHMKVFGVLAAILRLFIAILKLLIFFLISILKQRLQILGLPKLLLMLLPMFQPE